MTEQIVQSSSGDDPAEKSDTVVEPSNTEVTRTPLFQANHADRYLRQKLIRHIESQTDTRLICYVSGDECAIDHHDVMPFVDLLHNLAPGTAVDLLLHTSGGSIDSAEKLVKMVRSRTQTASFRVIVPNFAKSAGTLIVLGADSVLMSEMSELGPIDPQVFLSNGWQSAQDYLDAYQTHAQTLNKEPDNVAAQLMINNLNPATLKMCEKAKDRARKSAESLLIQGMFREKGNYTNTARELLDTTRWQSHSQMISWEDARDLGLVVQFVDYQGDEWKNYWELYCLQHLAVANRQKLYESENVSLVLGSAD